MLHHFAGKLTIRAKLLPTVAHSNSCRPLTCVQATRAYLHREEDVEAALQRAGFKVTKREMTATSFYFSRLLEAVRV